MSEKIDIETSTAQAFIKLYNAQMGTTYAIVEHADAPDVRCEDAQGKTLNLEITLTEDRPGDIKAALDRSDHKSVEALRSHLADVKAGRASIFESVSCLQGNVVDAVIHRIESKLLKDYGTDVALVIRTVSGTPFTWSKLTEQIKSCLESKLNPYDRGIWIISRWQDESVRLVQYHLSGCEQPDLRCIFPHAIL